MRQRDIKRAASHREAQRVNRATQHNLQQQRRGSLRISVDSLGRSNTNKRGPKSRDEGCVTRKQASPEQIMFRNLCASGMDPKQAKLQAYG